MAIVFHKYEALANTGLPEELVRFHEDDLPANSRSFCFAHAGKVCVDQTISHLVGHTLWDAGLVLAYYLDQTYSLANRKVLELGAGTGLVGIVAAALGAEVVLTDQTSVIDQTRKNIRQNAAQIEAGGGAAECLVLDWASPPVDWLQRKHFDYVLGGDVIYSAEGSQLLVNVLRILACKSKGAANILLAAEQRSDQLPVFMDIVRKTGMLEAREIATPFTAAIAQYAPITIVAIHTRRRRQQQRQQRLGGGVSEGGNDQAAPR